MNIKLILLTAVSVTTFVFGFIAENTLNLRVIPPGTGALILAVITFGFGLLFFGYLPWVITFLSGAYFGTAFRLKELTYLQIALAGISILIMAFASSFLGDSLYKDLTSKGNFSQDLKKILIIIAVALILALISEYAIII